MDDVIGCNWLLTQLNGLKVEEKENYNSKFLCQNATVQCRLKKNQENNQKSQKKIIVFSTENKKKFKIKLKMAALCYASKKTNTQNLYYYVISMFSRKKNQTQNTEPEIIDCAPPENGSKKTTRTLELELPQPLITVFLFVDVSFSPKKYPVAP